MPKTPNNLNDLCALAAELAPDHRRAEILEALRPFEAGMMAFQRAIAKGRRRLIDEYRAAFGYEDAFDDAISLGMPPDLRSESERRDALDRLASAVARRWAPRHLPKKWGLDGVGRDGLGEIRQEREAEKHCLARFGVLLVFYGLDQHESVFGLAGRILYQAQREADAELYDLQKSLRPPPPVPPDPDPGRNLLEIVADRGSPRTKACGRNYSRSAGDRMERAGSRSPGRMSCATGSADRPTWRTPWRCYSRLTALPARNRQTTSWSCSDEADAWLGTAAQSWDGAEGRADFLTGIMYLTQG